MAGDAEKREWAIELGAKSMTQECNRGQHNEHFSNTSTTSNVSTSLLESDVVNWFTIDASKNKKEKDETKPFIHQVQFHGPQGEIVWVWANIDDSAMKEVMSSETFRKVSHRLGTALLSSQLLRVANRTVIQSEAKWKRKVEVKGVSTDVVFEAFDSGGKWDFLFGKTLLESFKAVHDYEGDTITIQGNNREAILDNQACTASQTTPTPTTPICVVTEEEHMDKE